MNGEQGGHPAGGHSKHKGGSQQCQVCLKFTLPLVPQYLCDGQYCGKAYSASNVFLSEWLEIKGRDGGEAAFVLGVNNQQAGVFSSPPVHRVGRTGSLPTSLTFLLLHKNSSPG